MGEQPELPDVNDLATDAAVDATLQQNQQIRQMAMAQGGWRPACVSCFNEHKLAIMRVSQKLVKADVQPGTPEFAQAVQQAAQIGQVLMNNPMALQGLNGTKPDIIPAVRPADVLVGGNGVCGVCFQPQEEQPDQGLIVPRMRYSRRDLRAGP